MKRVIVDFKKLTPEILTLLVEKYPDGYDDTDIITFKNANNETIEAVEVRDQDAIYLVKVSKRLATRMENFDEEDHEVFNIEEVAVKDEDIDDDELNDDDDESFDEDTSTDDDTDDGENEDHDDVDSTKEEEEENDDEDY